MSSYPVTPEAFGEFVSQVKKSNNYPEKEPDVFGFGVVQNDRTTFEFPFFNVKENYGTYAILRHVLSSDQLRGCDPIFLQTLEEVLKYFKCFEGDGKKHGNIEYTKELLGLLSRDQIFSIWFVEVCADQDDLSANQRLLLQSAQESGRL